MIAQVVNMVPNEFVWTGGDTHLYSNSIEATKEILSRESFAPCQVVLNQTITDITAFRATDIIFEIYRLHPNISVEVAV